METNILKSTTVDTRNLSAKSLDSDKIILEGQDVLETIENGTPQIKDFVNRMDIGENEYYVIWDDTGQPVEWKTKDDILFDKIFYATGVKEVSSKWDFSKNTKLIYTFEKCSNLKSFENETLNNVTSFIGTFNNCNNLKSFKSKSTNKAEDIGGIFAECKNIETIIANFENVTNAGGSFSHCNKLKILNANFKKLENANSMFIHCSSLENIDLSNSPITNSTNLCDNCSNLKSFKGDLSRVEGKTPLTAYTATFQYCQNLENIDLTSLDSLINGNSFFNGCNSLKSFNYNLPNLKSARNMFYNCHELQTFDKDISNVENTIDMFRNCKKLSSFNSKITSLINGDRMFLGTILDAESVKRIITSFKEDNIADGTRGQEEGHLIHIGINANLKNDQEFINFITNSGIPQNTLNYNPYTVKITNTNGIGWNFHFYWNNPPAT